MGAPNQPLPPLWQNNASEPPGGWFSSRNFWRYYFAGQVAAGMCASESAMQQSGKFGMEPPVAFAKVAVGLADALLAELEATP